LLTIDFNQNYARSIAEIGDAFDGERAFNEGCIETITIASQQHRGGHEAAEKNDYRNDGGDIRH
jgi:hypothetical protein